MIRPMTSKPVAKPKAAIATLLSSWFALTSPAMAGSNGRSDRLIFYQ